MRLVRSLALAARGFKRGCLDVEFLVVMSHPQLAAVQSARSDASGHRVFRAGETPVSQVHAQARITPRTRAKIRSCADSSTELALRYTTTVATIRKWRTRHDMQDRSHCPHTLNTTLTPGQELLVIKLRRLPLDDLLVLVREFINPAVSRSGLNRCLVRHGVASST